MHKKTVNNNCDGEDMFGITVIQFFCYFKDDYAPHDYAEPVWGSVFSGILRHVGCTGLGIVL